MLGYIDKWLDYAVSVNDNIQKYYEVKFVVRDAPPDRIQMKYLYRALRKEEIDAGNISIPKSQGPFRRDPRFGIDMRFPIEFGSETSAVRQHQWEPRGFPTSGVSTTPHFEIAKKVYAKRNGVIVKINRQLFSKYGIKEYVVKEYLRKFPEDIAAPEDDEIILVKEDGGPFPKEIIEEVINIASGSKRIFIPTR